MYNLLTLSAPGGGGGDSHIKRVGMLVIPLRSYNPGFWYCLGCSKQNTYICIQQGTFYGCHGQLNGISFKHHLIQVFIFIAIKFIETNCLSVCVLRVHLKIPNEHPHPLYIPDC